MAGKKIIIAPDSFKETLSSQEVAAIISRELGSVADVVCEEVPIADGGEGTVDVMVNATGGEKVVVEVEDPLGRSVKAGYGILGDGITAVVELAAASGLHLLKKEERNPLQTSTYGTGQLIVHALQTSHCKKIIIGLGGSATNDGGVGLLQALGIDFFMKIERL